jgi:hypothetical protein
VERRELENIFISFDSERKTLEEKRVALLN